MLDEDQGLYTIGTVAELIDEHPETLRVWEKITSYTPKEKVSNAGIQIMTLSGFNLLSFY